MMLLHFNLITLTQHFSPNNYNIDKINKFYETVCYTIVNNLFGLEKQARFMCQLLNLENH